MAAPTPSFDIGQALELRINHGLSYTEIGKICGKSKQSIHNQLSKILPEKELIAQFRENKSDLIQYAQLKALQAYLSLDGQEQKDLLLRRGLVDMGIAFDKGQLQDGMSTSNVAVIHADIAAIKAARGGTGHE